MSLILDTVGSLSLITEGKAAVTTGSKSVVSICASPSSPKGNILVFMPGVHEVDKTCARIETGLGTHAVGNIRITALYSGQSSADQDLSGGAPSTSLRGL